MIVRASGLFADSITFVPMAHDRFATLRQSLPRIWKLLSELEPTFRIQTVSEIDGDFIERNDIRGILWDVDGTLMSYHAKDIDQQFPHIRALFRDGPARHAILSNCDEVRFDVLAGMFPEVPVVRGYATPNEPVFRYKLGGTDTHSPEEIQHILSHNGVQIRKPSGELIRYGMQLLGVDDPDAMLMVGDQYLTDIASANLAGARSAKVPTFRRETFPFPIRVSQRVERVLYALRTSRSPRRH
jgi:predicted HAD superfamily phosphohydrolase YqeG